MRDQRDPQDDLLEAVLSRENMQRAWDRVRANKGAPGIDGMTVDEFLEFARPHWEGILQALRSGRYNPQPVRRTEIPKSSGGTRPLGIPTVLDRVIQQAVAQVLTPIFEEIFSDHSYGFRPGRSAHDAVKAVQEMRSWGCCYAVDADLSKFFDKVNHDVLMRLLAKHVHNKSVLRLIGKYLRAGVVLDPKSNPTTVTATPTGVPQGGPLSPLLANVVLHELDCELARRGHCFVRYADDFIVLVRSQRTGERVLGSIRRWLQTNLRLELNDSKSSVVSVEGCEFLGFVFRGNQIRWSDKSEREFKRRIKELTKRSWGVSMGYRLFKLSEYIRGWMGYFGISEYYSSLPRIDEWLRRRIRLCYWKQWGRPRRRIGALLKLGVDKLSAVCAGRSRKGPWRLSRTLATNSGMSNAWLATQGLISVRALWIARHYPDGGVRRLRDKTSKGNAIQH